MLGWGLFASGRGPLPPQNTPNTPIHNILSTDPQLSITHKALETLPDDGNVMPKNVGTTIYS
jgi:hypothetical protein